VSNLKKEIDAIQAKEIAQGGLTQGQQTQIARNELRMDQIAEELESLEETLNESIQESIGARTGRVGLKNMKGVVEDEDKGQSDDDEFYDRTKRRMGPDQKAEEKQTVETAESLLEKRENIAKDIENTMAALQAEEPSNQTYNSRGILVSEDPLDAFMTGLSSQIVKDRTTRLQNKLDRLQSEMDRVVFLLKIADPTGEVSRKQDSQLCTSTPFQAGKLLLSSAGKPMNTHISSDQKNPNKLQRGNNAVGAKFSEEKSFVLTAVVDGASQHEKSGSGDSDKEVKSTSGGFDEEISATMKQRWLGAVHDTEDKVHNEEKFIHLESAFDSIDFVGYKDRIKALTSSNEARISVSILEDAEGLVLRKPKAINCKSNPKKVNREDNEIENASSTTTGVAAETSAEDAVALLLRHKRGLSSSDKQDQSKEQDVICSNECASNECAQKKKSRRLGPEKPAFLKEDCTRYDAWVPPQ
ncbi:hypothetical protein KI387_013162, partial [Taxus chinensis]